MTPRRSTFLTAGWTRSSLAALLLVCAAPSCGDDDDSKSSSAGTGGSTPPKAGNSAAGAPSYTAPEPVACGPNTCEAPASPIAGLLGTFGGGAGLGTMIPTATACCLADDACGVSSTMSPSLCEPPATPDNRCPSLDLGAAGQLLGGATQMLGCCIKDQCGQDGALLGRGCVENSEAASMLTSIPLIGPMIDVPAPRACDAIVDTDAGTEDAGI